MRALRIDEPDEDRWSELILPDDPGLSLLRAAVGVVAAAAEADGRTRALDLLQAGGDFATLLASRILQVALAPGR